MRQVLSGFPQTDSYGSTGNESWLTCLHGMQESGGDDIVKVPRISLNLLTLKTETEQHNGFGTC